MTTHSPVGQGLPLQRGEGLADKMRHPIAGTMTATREVSMPEMGRCSWAGQTPRLRNALHSAPERIVMADAIMRAIWSVRVICRSLSDLWL
jgi:hypothetical protein